MSAQPFDIAPLNENTLLLSFGNVINTTVNETVIDLYSLLQQHPFKGYIEAVPAYASIAVYYDAVTVRQNNKNGNSAFEWVKQYVLQLMNRLDEKQFHQPQDCIRIPVYYNGEDLEYIAAQHHITVEEVITLHHSKTYRVFMTGFLPGFAYMGMVDEKINTPRKAQPQMHVPAGSVGIAGAQTGIYPLDSPGGWQLIGTTPLQLFDPSATQPCLLKAGDKVQFVPIDKTTFNATNVHRHS
ncbi:MAG: 5-oxoprolinase subunit PxpB [Bacteroidetes bacterium]|nr:5-oxoprolinase subunit PxpB [Bacteroidota bacterium]